MTNYVDRFHAALTVLAGHGHIKQRLIKAFEDNLANISEDEIPPAARQSFSDLRLKMRDVIPANGEGSTCATVRKMSLVEASDCAAAMVTLYGELSRLRDDTQVSLPLMGGQESRVPPFLVKSV